MTPLKLLTTAEPIGVATRDIVVIVGAALTVLGTLGLLTEEQVQTLTEQAPILLASLGAVMTVGMSVYRTITKSMSDRAAEVAKETDAAIPPSQTVTVKTPAGEPDIKVGPRP